MGYGLEKKLKEHTFKRVGWSDPVEQEVITKELKAEAVYFSVVKKELGVVAQKIQEQARKGNDIEDRIRSARNAYRRKDLSFETYNKIRDEKFVPLDAVLGLLVEGEK